MEHALVQTMISIDVSIIALPCLVMRHEIHQHQLPLETITAMNELGSVLESIYQRLRNEGYRMEDGKIIQTIQNEDNIK